MFYLLFIGFLIVFLISSVLFISSSLKKEIFSTLDNQSDFIIQKTNNGKIFDAPISWIDDFSNKIFPMNLQINYLDFVYEK